MTKIDQNVKKNKLQFCIKILISKIYSILNILTQKKYLCFLLLQFHPQFLQSYA